MRKNGVKIKLRKENGQMSFQMRFLLSLRRSRRTNNEQGYRDNLATICEGNWKMAAACIACMLISTITMIHHDVA